VAATVGLPFLRGCVVVLTDLIIDTSAVSTPAAAARIEDALRA
jgi:hypothetical protein